MFRRLKCLLLFCLCFSVVWTTRVSRKFSRRRTITVKVLDDEILRRLNELESEFRALERRVEILEEARDTFAAVLRFERDRATGELQPNERIEFDLFKNPFNIEDIFDPDYRGYNVQESGCHTICVAMDDFNLGDVPGRSDIAVFELTLKKAKRRITTVSETSVSNVEGFIGSGAVCYLTNLTKGNVIEAGEDDDGGFVSKILLYISKNC